MSIQHQSMVFESEGLSSAEKLLLLAYCNYTDGHGYCWAGVERIADDTGASVRTVKRTRTALIEKNLLGTKRRVNPKTGQPIPNLTRVNLTMLASMKRQKRLYDDNVIEQISFADNSPAFTRDDASSDQQTCQSDTDPDLQTCHSGTPLDNLAPTRGQIGTATTGAKLAPNPSVHPSSSSAPGVTSDPDGAAEEDEEQSENPTAAPAPTPVTAVMEATGASAHEAQTLVGDIRRDPAVRSVARYVQTLIANGDMAERLARRRGRAAPSTSPRTELCEEHTRPLPCPFCVQDAAAPQKRKES